MTEASHLEVGGFISATHKLKCALFKMCRVKRARYALTVVLILIRHLPLEVMGQG